MLTELVLIFYVLPALSEHTGFTIVYGVMYLVLKKDEYALLAGAVISFIAIAATIFSPDWSTGLGDGTSQARNSTDDVVS